MHSSSRAKEHDNSYPDSLVSVVRAAATWTSRLHVGPDPGPGRFRRGTTFSQLPLNWPIIEAGYM